METDNSQPKISKLIFGFAAIAISVAGILPWVFAQQKFPEEPIGVTSLYRSQWGETEYYPIISELAEGKTKGHTIKEHEGTIKRSFPNFTVAIHALGLACFGAWGLAAGDIVIGWIYFAVAFFFFRTLRMSPYASFLAAIFLTLRIPVSLLDFGIPGPWGVLTRIWSSRLPRPIISEPLLLLAIIATMKLLFAKDPSKLRYWFFLGLAYSVPLYGDMHAAIIFGIASPVLLLLLRRMPLLGFIQGIGVSMIPYVALLIPFILRRINEHPDVPVRFGVFPVDRLHPILIREDLAWFALSAGVFAITLWFIRWSQSKKWRPVLDGHGFEFGPLAYFCGFILIGFWSATISCVFLGKTIQVYHFGGRSLILLFYFLFLMAINVADAIICETIRRSRVKMNGSFGLIAAVSAMFVVTVAHGATKSTIVAQETHFKSPFSYVDHLSPSYRNCLSELATFMEAVPDKSVVGCVDMGVFAWWLTYRDGHWFLVEPFVSAIPDAELEKRLMLFGKQLRMSPDQFVEFINRIEINLFWLGSAKYQATRAYTFRPIDDYTPDQQHLIRSVSARDPWKVLIPRSEIARLRREYQTTSLAEMSARQLDVIVLTNDDGESQFSPPADGWKKVFENAVFRVFVRKP